MLGRQRPNLLAKETGAVSQWWAVGCERRLFGEVAAGVGGGVMGRSDGEAVGRSAGGAVGR